MLSSSEKDRQGSEFIDYLKVDLIWISQYRRSDWDLETIIVSQSRTARNKEARILKAGVWRIWNSPAWGFQLMCLSGSLLKHKSPGRVKSCANEGTGIVKAC